MCLEQMTGRPVPEGALYYASSRRRRVVPITAALRQAVVNTAAAVSEMLQQQVLPPALTGELAAQRCKGCSLKDRCQPEAAASPLMALLRSQLFDPDA